METVYYNFYAFQDAKASGGDTPHALLVRERAPRRRPMAGEKIVSLDEYRARRDALTATQAEDAEPWETPEEELSVPAQGEDCPSQARSHRRERMLAGLELAACGAIILLAAVACAVFLL